MAEYNVNEDHVKGPNHVKTDPREKTDVVVVFVSRICIVLLKTKIIWWISVGVNVIMQVLVLRIYFFFQRILWLKIVFLQVNYKINLSRNTRKCKHCDIKWKEYEQTVDKCRGMARLKHSTVTWSQSSCLCVMWWLFSNYCVGLSYIGILFRVQ